MTDVSVMKNLSLFIRRIRISKMFTHCETYSEEKRNLFIPNPLFIPQPAGNSLEYYIREITSKVEQRLKGIPYHRIIQHPVITSSLTALKNDKSIIITNCDKNLGVCIIDRLNYEKEALRQLTDSKAYKQLIGLPSAENVYESLIELLSVHNMLFLPNSTKETHISKYLLQLRLRPLKAARFYSLMKIHKSPVVGRPIVSSIGTLTYHASKYLDSILQPLAKQTAFYVKNSFTFLADLRIKTFPSDSVILTADVESLYPSIPINDGLVQLRDFLELSKIESSQTSFIVDLTSWVLKNNFIEFGDLFFLQTKGTAMGTPVAVAFATIYLAMLERTVIQRCISMNPTFSILYAKRFIDDIFSVFGSCDHAQLFINTYNEVRSGIISLTHVISNTSGVFLDTEIFKSEQFCSTGIFDSRIYQKPQNKFLYLPRFSFHNPAVFKSTVLSELMRYRILCSLDTDYDTVKQSFYERLLARGHAQTELDDWFSILISRDHLFEVRMKSNKQSTHPLILTLPFTLRSKALRLRDAIQPTLAAMSDPDFRYIFGHPPRPIICYLRAPNLRDLLSRSKYDFSVVLNQGSPPN